MSREQLIKDIEAVFGPLAYPSGPLTDSCYDEGIAAFFSGKRWQELTIIELRRYSAALSFLQPEAFRYFLPAFMRAELIDPASADVIGQSIVYKFAEPEAFWAATYEQRLALFSAAEKRVILEFLDYMQTTYGQFEDDVIYAASRLL